MQKKICLLSYLVITASLFGGIDSLNCMIGKSAIKSGSSQDPNFHSVSFNGQKQTLGSLIFGTIQNQEHPFAKTLLIAKEGDSFAQEGVVRSITVKNMETILKGNYTYVDLKTKGKSDLPHAAIILGTQGYDKGDELRYLVAFHQQLFQERKKEFEAQGDD